MCYLEHILPIHVPCPQQEDHEEHEADKNCTQNGTLAIDVELAEDSVKVDDVRGEVEGNGGDELFLVTAHTHGLLVIRVSFNLLD